jgi:tRNA1(Val) A37 N6-methylase TrmN6
MHESLIDYSFRLGEAVLAHKSSVSRKEQGQFLTPPAVARYMAWQLGPLHSGQRILDPSIGSGVLSCAVIERAILDQKPIELWLDCFDIDADMCATARQSLEHAAQIAAQSDVKVHFTIHNYDFALSDVPVQQSLLPAHFVREQAQPTLYDHIIANPPYFKLQASKRRCSCEALCQPRRQPHKHLFAFHCAGYSQARQHGRPGLLHRAAKFLLRRILRRLPTAFSSGGSAAFGTFI